MQPCPEALRYPLISWRPITHLFWDTYPYKVETLYPARGFRPMPVSHARRQNSSILFMIGMDRMRYQRVVANFRRGCERHLPDDHTRWKTLETEIAFHFYFQHREDMLRFIAGNARKIRTVYEPASPADLDRLLNAKYTYLRPTLFFDAYTFRVQFRAMPALVVEELDGWVQALFGGRPEDHKYNSFGKRCLYLTHENDILLTRLAFSAYILRVERVILRSSD